MVKKLTALILSTIFCCIVCQTLKAQAIHLLPPNQPEQDACNALSLCGNKFSTPYSYQGYGAVLDLDETPCDPTPGGGEDNSVWLKLQVATSGTIVFRIIPLDSVDDYDFAVLNISNTTCSNLSSNNVVRCNFNNNEAGSNLGGIVGLNMASNMPYVGAGVTGSSYCQYINAVAGETYLVMINNFGHDDNPGPSKGFSVDFTGSTATFDQTPPPAFASIDTPACNNVTSITLHTTKPFLCNSVAPNGSDFTITPALAISGAAGVNCSSDSGYSNAVTITFATPPAAGTYTVTAKQGTDGNTLLGLCGSQLQLPESLTFTVPAAITSVDSEFTCYNQLPYSWHGQSVTKGGNNAATFIATSAAGCDSTITLKLIVSSPPAADSATKLICTGGSYNLPWNDSTVTSAGVYQHAYPGMNGCDSLISTITVNIDNPSQNFKYLLCNDSSKTLSIGSGYTNYTWGNGATTPTITINQPGNYPVQATDSLGCVANDNFSISTDVITASLIKKIPLCQGSVLTITATAGFVSYLWNTGVTQPSINISTAGTYWLTVVDTVGCQATDTATVVSVPVPVNFLPSSITKCFYATLTLQPYNTYNAYLWSNGDSTQTINVLPAGTYSLQVTDANGCIGLDSTIVLDSACAEYLYVPTAFTPNGDGYNDVFKPAFAGLAVHYSFKVLNRWGQIVFTSNNPADGWDGTVNGNPQSAGVYVWYCQYQLYERNPVSQKGTVVLVR